VTIAGIGEKVNVGKPSLAMRAARYTQFISY
jgi:hypothetical protein